MWHTQSMAKDPPKSVEALLLEAAISIRKVTSTDKPWVYGWSIEGYRRTAAATLPSKSGSVGMEPDGVQSYERAVGMLLSEKIIRERWDSEEIWGLVATLVVSAWESTSASGRIASGLSKLRSNLETLVVIPIANVTWDSAPMTLAGNVVGVLDDHFVEIVARESDGRPDLSSASAQKWISLQTVPMRLSRITKDENSKRDVVVAAVWAKREMTSANDYADEWIEALCCLALLAQEDLSELELWSLRGAYNRPGTRGIVLDRRSVNDAFSSISGGESELTSQPFLESAEFGTSETVHWLNADPVPLDKLIALGNRDHWLENALKGQDPICKRLRVAARWHAEAHWTDNGINAVLALGVALDALVGSQSALPGRVMAQRFAHLDPNPECRKERITRYNDLYSVRSSVAHGGESSQINEMGFVREFASEVRWAARRLTEFASRFAVQTEKQMDSVFEDLSLGVQSWH